MAKTGRTGTDEIHHRVGQKSGRDREIESGRMGDDYEIGAGGGCKGIRRFECVSSNHSSVNQLINQQ